MSVNSIQFDRNDEALLLLDEIRQLENNMSQLKQRSDALKRQLIEIVGDADYFVSPDDLKIGTYKEVKESYIFDSASFKKDHENLYERYKTKKRSSYRVLKFDKAWGGI